MKTKMVSKENEETIKQLKKMGVKNKLMEGFCNICMERTVFEKRNDRWRCTHSSEAHSNYNEIIAKKSIRRMLRGLK